MSNTLKVDQVVAVLTALTHDLEAAKDELTVLDSAIGDGDLGISVSRGFRAVREGLAEPSSDISRVVAKVGMDFSNGAGSTIGALLGTGFMRAGKAVQGLDAIGVAELARMVQAAQAGISEKGKAQPGDKTMLDAIAPAAAALEQAAQEQLSIEEALERARAAAESGMLATQPMQSAFGRARWLAERTIGHQDPGATLVHLIFKSAAASVARLAAKQ